MIKRRRRFKQTVPLRDRLTMWANDVRGLAAELPPGPDREALLKKARQADTASHLEEWVSSPSLQPK
jgi:hypothetical protein